jgi:hypothetical protein
VWNGDTACIEASTGWPVGKVQRRKGMIRSLIRGSKRKTAVLATIMLAGLAATFATPAPAHAATARTAGGSSLASTVTPQDGTGRNGWVSMFAANVGGGQVVVTAELIPPGDIAFSYGHWEILTPLGHYNTHDGTYQSFGGDFAHATGNYCAIWWYRDGLGNYTDEGFPCVWVN